MSAFINARVSDEAQVEDISLLDRVRLFGKSVGLFKNADMTGDPAKKRRPNSCTAQKTTLIPSRENFWL